MNELAVIRYTTVSGDRYLHASGLLGVGSHNRACTG